MGSVAKKQAGSKKTQKNAEEQRKLRIKQEIVAISLIAVGVFLAFGLIFDSAGKIGGFLNTVFSGCFGAMSYAFPFFMIAYGIFLFAGISRAWSLRPVIFTVVIFLMLNIIFAASHLTSDGSFPNGETFSEIFHASKIGESGGIVGMYISKLIVSLIGKIGLYIATIALIIISAIVIINTPVSQYAGVVREKHLSAKEIRMQRKAEREAARAASGYYDDDDDDEYEFEYDYGYGSGKDGSKPVITTKEEKESIKIPPFLKPAISSKKENILETVQNDETYGVVEDEPYGNFGIEDNNFSDENSAELEIDNTGLQYEIPVNKKSVTYGIDGYDEFDGTNSEGIKSGGGQYGLGDYDGLGGDENDEKQEIDISPSEEESIDEFEPFDVSDIGADPVVQPVKVDAPMTFTEPKKTMPKVVSTPVAKPATPKVQDMHYESNQDDSRYKLPPLDLLNKAKGKVKGESQAELKRNAARLEKALIDFRVEAKVLKVTVGPTVTRYEVEPAVGVKIQNIKSLEPDLALKLEVKSVRVVPMPGQAVVGVEAYNSNANIVTLREIIDSPDFMENTSKTAFVLGKNISGKKIIADLKDMPHLLIAGTTGSGKSVCVNSILLSLIYKAKPSELKLILVDPKVVELKSYNEIPHLLLPVVTDPERAAMALGHAVMIMNDRYKKFSDKDVRNLDGFNEKMRKEGQYDEVLPQIVIVIDELADLMQVASAKVQDSISRLAAMARAAGMHLIVATQQPLASILTSVIKANIPSRIAFSVSSNSASRVILDNPGAERLLGKGDMLFSPVGTREPMRVQGSFVSDSEVHRVTEYVKKQMDPSYSNEMVDEVIAGPPSSLVDDEDDLFMDAVEMVAQSKTRQASVSMIQRRFRIGYNRAARLVDMMEERGIVGESDGSNKPRTIIMTDAQLASFLGKPEQLSAFDIDDVGGDFDE